jgi:hypothetical protein
MSELAKEQSIDRIIALGSLLIKVNSSYESNKKTLA